MVEKKETHTRAEIETFSESIRLKVAHKLAGGYDYDDVMVDIAQEVMHFAHRGQALRMGGPYTDHTQYVGDHLPDPVDQVIGYLHDALENSSLTADDLLEMGFSPEVVDNIKIMTKPKGMQEYLDYLESLVPYPRACRVKLVDMCHNNHVDRQPEVELTAKRVLRLECYSIGIPFMQYLNHLRSTGKPSDAMHANNVSVGIFMYETDFLQRLTPDQRESVRNVLLETSIDPARQYWYEKAANDTDIREHPRYHLEPVPCAA